MRFQYCSGFLNEFRHTLASLQCPKAIPYITRNLTSWIFRSLVLEDDDCDDILFIRIESQLHAIETLVRKDSMRNTDYSSSFISVSGDPGNCLKDPAITMVGLTPLFHG